MNTIETLRYNELLNTMINDYGVKDVTNERQIKNNTRAFETIRGEKFQIYKSGYIRRTITSCYYGSMVYQINPTIKSKRGYIGFYNETFKKYIREESVRLKIHSELGRLVYLFNFLVKNKYISKQTNKLNASITY